MEQEQFLFFSSKIVGFSPRKDKKYFVWKLPNVKSGNGDQIVHAGYTKRICNMLVFFKYADIYTSIQMHILSIYVTIIVIIFRY